MPLEREVDLGRSFHLPPGVARAKRLMSRDEVLPSQGGNIDQPGTDTLLRRFRPKALEVISPWKGLRPRLRFLLEAEIPQPGSGS